MRILLPAALAALAFPVWCPAQQTAASAPDPVITVEFSNPQLSPSHWTLVFHPDGSGHFRSQMGPASSNSGDDMRVPDLDRDVQLSPQFAASVFRVAKTHAWFNQPCESHMKVAFQGWKTFRYSGPAGQGSCTFNYSRDREIQSLGDAFVGVAETVVEGARLEMLLQHDPLGLDQEMETLTAAAQNGSAQQICVIKGILQRLAGDQDVMEIVRKRARALLARAET